jgi:hypothetical protein
VDSLFSRQNAFAARYDTVLARIHQLKGRTLDGMLSQDTLRTLDVGPNAELIYYLANEEDEPDGAVQTSADRIRFLFTDGDLSRATVIGQTEGTYCPQQLLPDQFELSGFSWVPQNRPDREGLLNDDRVREAFERPEAAPEAAPLVISGEAVPAGP